ncbi:MAG: TRAP transporter small permease [Salinarimonadaceae bacterium]|nr:MAG: TRAP transporter small permease [Salinarimonadaceae bacterium]
MAGVAQVANAAGTLVVLGLVVLINSDVISRNAFNAPFRGTYEAVQFLLVMIVFLQLPDVVRINRLTRSDGFLAILSERKPALARIFARMIDTLAAIFMGLAAYAIWPEFLRAWHEGTFFGTPGIFTAPYWPIKLVICLSTALCALIFVTKAISGKRRPERLHLEESGA